MKKFLGAKPPAGDIFTFIDGYKGNNPLFDGVISAVDFSPNEYLLGCGNYNFSSYIFSLDSLDKKTFKKMIFTFKDHQGSVSAVAFSPNGLYFATGGRDFNSFIYEVNTGKMFLKILGKHSSYVNGVSFSSNGEYFVSASGDRTIKIHGVNPQNYHTFGQQIYVVDKYIKPVACIAFHPYLNLFAAGSKDKTARIFEVNEIRSEFDKITSIIISDYAVFTEQTSYVWSVSFSMDGDLLAIGCNDYTAIIYGVNQYSPESFKKALVKLDHQAAVRGVCFSMNFNLFSLACYNKYTTIYDISKIESIKKVKQFSFEESLNTVSFSSDGFLFAVGTNEGMVKVFC